MNIKQLIPLLCFFIGFLMALICALIFFLGLKPIIRNLLAKELVIQENSNAMENFRVIPIPMKFSVTFFNVSNPQDFDGISTKSLKFIPIGPYVWEEMREKINITFDETEDWVSYNLVKRFNFSQELSGPERKPSDSISLANIILGTNMNEFAETVFLTDKVENFVFKGTPFLMGNSLFKNPSINKVTTVSTGRSDISQIKQTKQYNGETIMKAWKPNSTCNLMRGTDGTEFAPYYDSEPFFIFEPNGCQSLQVVNDESVMPSRDVHGISTRRFFPKPRDHATRECFCMEESLDECPEGTLNIKSCGEEFAKLDLNVILTSAYFLGNPELLNETSLEPPENFTVDNYGTFLDVEPITGMVIRAFSRIQMNIQIKRTNETIINKLEKKKELMPFIMIEETGEIDLENAQILATQLKPLGFLSIGLGAGMALGAILAVTCLVICLSTGSSKKKGSSPSKMNGGSNLNNEEKSEPNNYWSYN